MNSCLSHSHKGIYHFSGKLEWVSEQRFLVFLIFFDSIECTIIMGRKNGSYDSAHKGRIFKLPKGSWGLETLI